MMRVMEMERLIDWVVSKMKRKKKWFYDMKKKKSQFAFI